MDHVPLDTNEVTHDRCHHKDEDGEEAALVLVQCIETNQYGFDELVDRVEEEVEHDAQVSEPGKRGDLYYNVLAEGYH